MTHRRQAGLGARRRPGGSSTGRPLRARARRSYPEFMDERWHRRFRTASARGEAACRAARRISLTDALARKARRRASRASARRGRRAPRDPCPEFHSSTNGMLICLNDIACRVNRSARARVPARLLPAPSGRVRSRTSRARAWNRRCGRPRGRAAACGGRPRGTRAGPRWRSRFPSDRDRSRTRRRARRRPPNSRSSRRLSHRRRSFA
jgi:hypothetical protein